MRPDDLKRDEWLTLGLALLLALDLLVLPWLSLPAGATLTIRGATLTIGGGSPSGTGAPDGWLGVLAVIGLLAVLADIAIEHLSPQTQVPAIDGSRITTRYWLAVVAAVCLALKFIFHIGSIGNLGFGFWAGAVLTVALVYVARRARAEQPAATARASAASQPSSRGTEPGGRPTESGPPTV